MRLKQRPCPLKRRHAHLTEAMLLKQRLVNHIIRRKTEAKACIRGRYSAAYKRRPPPLKIGEEYDGGHFNLIY
jgi:hypothetical protein